MNAILFLINEHEKVKHILADICDKSHKEETKLKIFHELAHHLIRHETMEQKIWYPHFKDKLEDTVKHLISEEKSAAQAIIELEKIKNQNMWDEKFLKFKNDVEHHASEEEHKLFPNVKKILTEEELEKIGKEMYEFKKEFDEN
jgi:hypothetical protein